MLEHDIIIYIETEAAVMKRLMSIVAALWMTLVCMDAAAQAPLRAVVFYQDRTWLQEFNIMRQIALKTQTALEGQNQVALSCYGLETVSIEKTVQAAIDMQADVLICNALDSENALAAYAKLNEAGIQLLFVDGDNKKAARYAYVGTDNAESGRWALDWIIEHCGQDASIALLMPTLNTSMCSVGARAEQFLKRAEERGAAITAECETSFDSLEAMRKIGIMLDEHPEIDVLFCTEAVSGKAAATLVQERGLCDEITVITYDRFARIDEYLESGAVDVTLTQNTEAIGTMCAQTLIRMAENANSEDVYFSCLPIYGNGATP